MKALVDGDIVAFRAAASAENEDVWIACSRAQTIIEQILVETNSNEYEIWLTGKGNFRYNVYPEYKGNRRGMYRPKWEKEVKQYLVLDWEANTAEGCEADDMLGARQTADTIIATIDKDLNQIQGWHYNFVKKEQYYVSPEEADRYFYYQLLIGDTTDNIKGVSGIGPKKADRLLNSLKPNEWYQAILDLYSCEEELDMNAQCVYIWRKENDNWRNLVNEACIVQGQGAPPAAVGAGFDPDTVPILGEG